MGQYSPEVTVFAMSSDLTPGAPKAPEELTPEEEASLNAEPEEVFEDLLEEETTAAAREEGGVLEGRIVNVRSDGYFVDIGRKSEAFLPRDTSRRGDQAQQQAQQDEQEELTPGDKIEVSVTGRSPDGYLTLSRVIAERPADWAGFERAFQEGTPVAGRVTGAIKGGLSVDVGARAFLPASRSGTRDAEELQALVGEEIRCRIIQLDIDDQNIVVDRRVLLEEEKQRQREETLARLEPGKVVKGAVRKVMDFGAFVDLGAIDGLLHVSDMAWSKVKDPKSVVSEGDELEVKILKVAEGGKRISLGLKQLTPDPWTAIGEKLQMGDRVKGTVTRLTDFGAFVEIEPGVEGLVHISEMSWARRVRHPKDLVKAGDAVDAVVLEIKPEERRIGLGIKQALGDPWERAAERFPVGAKVEGRVSKLAKFGAFVEVDEGVEGLLHISDITSERRLNHPSEVLKQDQTVQAVVLSVDTEKRRLKLGMKQLEPDDQDRFIEQLQTGDTVTGRVVRISGGEATVELGEGVKGLCVLDAESPSEAPAAEPEPRDKPADVSSLGDMLQAAWKGGAGESGERAAPVRKPEKLQPGEVRSFKVTELDPKSKAIRLALN